MSVYASLCSFHLANISWPVPVQGAVTEKVQPQAWLQYPKACPGRMGMSSQETCETSEASWEVRTWQEPWEEPVPVCPCHDISEGEKNPFICLHVPWGSVHHRVVLSCQGYLCWPQYSYSCRGLVFGTWLIENRLN